MKRLSRCAASQASRLQSIAPGTADSTAAKVASQRTVMVSTSAAAESDSEEQTITAAWEILKKRLMRLGCLSDPTSATDFLRMRLASIEHEVFYVIYLDSRHSIIAADIAFAGTIDGAEVYPREIVKLALYYNAAAIICAHNHPSQNAEPSSADRAVTARLKQALALVDVRLLDHFVVTASGFTSLAARGWV